VPGDCIALRDSYMDTIMQSFATPSSNARPRGARFRAHLDFDQLQQPDSVTREVEAMLTVAATHG
jgi:hypothetical protein